MVNAKETFSPLQDVPRYGMLTPRVMKNVISDPILQKKRDRVTDQPIPLQ